MIAALCLTLFSWFWMCPVYISYLFLLQISPKYVCNQLFSEIHCSFMTLKKTCFFKYILIHLNLLLSNNIALYCVLKILSLVCPMCRAAFFQLAVPCVFPFIELKSNFSTFPQWNTYIWQALTFSFPFEGPHLLTHLLFIPLEALHLTQ